MKKLLFVALAALMSVCMSSSQEKWYASANLNLTGSSGGGYIKSAGAGFDLNHMVSKN